MNIVSKRAGLFILCILFVLLPGGCAPAKAAKDGAELNVHLRQSPAAIDPQLIADVYSSEVSSYYTGTLYEVDPERTPLERWQAAHGRGLRLWTAETCGSRNKKQLGLFDHGLLRRSQRRKGGCR